jgi:acetyl esterase
MSRYDATLSLQMQAVIARMTELNGSIAARYDLPFPEARAALLAQRVWWQLEAPVMAHDAAFTIEHDGRRVAAHSFVPPNADAHRAILFMHGGGWCVGSVATHAAVMRWIALEAGCEVIGLDYALAPEAPFPAAIEDVAASVAWLRSTRPHTRYVLAGDSAGANLAIVEALAQRDRDALSCSGLALYYGAYGPARTTGSFATFGPGGFGLTNDAMRRYMEAYAPSLAASRDPRLYPLFADLRGLPPVLSIAAGCDPLLDDSYDMDAALRVAGVDCEFIVMSGVLHGFIAYWRVLDAARDSFARIGRFVRSLK